MPQITVQLVTYNAAKYIPHLFASLAAQTNTDWQLAMLDNASTDGTTEMVYKYATELNIPYSIIVEEKNSGFTGGHNRLFSVLSTPYVLLLNQDVYLDKNCINELLNVAKSIPHFGAITPRVMRWDFTKAEIFGLSASFTKYIDTLGLAIHRTRQVTDIGAGELWGGIEHYASIQVNSHNSAEVFGVSGALPFYSSAAARAVAHSDGSIFDPTFFMYKEDVDLAFRLRSSGFASFLAYNAVAYHNRTAYQSSSSVFALLKNKHAQSAMVRHESYANHLACLIKNEYVSNFGLDFLAIICYEFGKFIWYLFMDFGTILYAWRKLWKNKTWILTQRAYIRMKQKILYKDN